MRLFQEVCEGAFAHSVSRQPKLSSSGFWTEHSMAFCFSYASSFHGELETHLAIFCGSALHHLFIVSATKVDQTIESRECQVRRHPKMPHSKMQLSHSRKSILCRLEPKLTLFFTVEEFNHMSCECSWCNKCIAPGGVKQTGLETDLRRTC